MDDPRFDNLTNIDGGRIIKMEVDYSSACDEKIPALKEAAKDPAKFHQSIDGLLQLEKQTRLGADMVSCSRVLCAIVQICFEARNWNALNEHIALLVKRRSQLKQAVVKMVQECCTYVDQITEKEVKLKLIDTLRTVTEGKIYVEVERARLTKILANIREADGDIVEAANVMEELQVETYGTMEKREKVELILEQMRLCLAKQDLVRAQIIAKKISIKFFDDPEQQDLKYKYYCIMVSVWFGKKGGKFEKQKNLKEILLLKGSCVVKVYLAWQKKKIRSKNIFPHFLDVRGVLESRLWL